MKRPNKPDYFIYAIWRWWWLNKGRGEGRRRMPVYTDKDVKEMTLQEKKETCQWCFYHDYGDCNKCALNPPETRFEQVEENDK